MLQVLQTWATKDTNLIQRYCRSELQVLQTWGTNTMNLKYRYCRSGLLVLQMWATSTMNLRYRDYSPVLMLSLLYLPGDCSSCWLCVSWFMPQAPTGACNKQSLACFNPHAINSHLHVSHRMQQTVACMFHNACKIQDFQASLCEPHAVKVCYSQCGLQSFSRRKNPAEHLTLV